jgi:hypothetical protein
MVEIRLGREMVAPFLGVLAIAVALYLAWELQRLQGNSPLSLAASIVAALTFLTFTSHLVISRTQKQDDPELEQRRIQGRGAQFFISRWINNPSPSNLKNIEEQVAILRKLTRREK